MYMEIEGVSMIIFQKGFNFSQDGPGNRLVYHIAGCNMQCPWCSNPEGMKIDHKYKNYTVSEIIDEAIKCKMLFISGGGVTFTGGEATLNANELLMILKELKNNDIHTAIETNGTSEKLPELLEYIDYLIMDFKHYDNDIIKSYTGMSNKIIKKNFENNCKNGRFQHIRIPLINGFNADGARGFCDYFTQFNTENAVFEFLLYHEYGKSKWQSEYIINDGFVKKEQYQEFVRLFNENNLKLITT